MTKNKPRPHDCFATAHLYSKLDNRKLSRGLKRAKKLLALFAAKMDIDTDGHRHR